VRRRFVLRRRLFHELGRRAFHVKYGFTRTVALSYDRAVERVAEELKKQGFGVLTSIDVKATLK